MNPSVTAQKTKLEAHTLANGSTLYYHQVEGAPRVAMNIYVYGGNRLDPMPGVADMIDDLLNEGTHKRSAEQIAVDLDGLSLDMDTDTRRDYSSVSTTFLEEDLEASMELVSDQLFNSTLAEFEKEKVRLHGELTMDLDSPRNRSHDLLMTEMFKDTPYRASHANILETIPKLNDVSLLAKHYEALYQPQNTFYTVTGDVNIDEIKPLLEQYFVRGQGQNLAEQSPHHQFEVPENLYLTGAKDDSTQMHIFKAWFAPPMSHPDYPAMAVLNTILGGAGLTSRLFLELRDKQGLAYVVRSQYESSRYTGLFSLYIGTEPSNRKKALKGFEVECDKLMQNPVGHQELEEAKENIQGRRVVFLETGPQLASYLGNFLALGIKPEEIQALPERIQQVTALQVQEVAQKYMQKFSIISAVGPADAL